MKYLVYSSCHLGHLGKKVISLLVGQIDQFAHVLFMSQDHSSLLALLLKYIEKACFHLTDRVGKLCCQFSLHTICTIWIFYYFCHRFSPFHSAPSCRTARAVLNHYCFKDTTDAAKFQQLSYCQFPLSSKYCNHSGRGNAFRHSEQLQRILRKSL